MTSRGVVQALRITILRQAYRGAYWTLWAFSLVAHPRGRGVKGLIRNGGEVLFVRHTYGPYEWELPGGGQHRHELPGEAVARELREELGIEVTTAVLLGTGNGPRQYANNCVTFFTIDIANRDLQPDPVEIAEVRWSDPADPPLPLGWYAADVLRRARAQP